MHKMNTIKIALFGIISVAVAPILLYKYVLLFAICYLLFWIFRKNTIADLEAKWIAAGVSLIVKRRLRLFYFVAHLQFNCRFFFFDVSRIITKKRGALFFFWARPPHVFTWSCTYTRCSYRQCLWSYSHGERWLTETARSQAALACLWNGSNESCSNSS